MAEQLAGNPQASNWLLDWIRGNTRMGQALAPSIEQQVNLPVRQEIQNAGVDINRQIPPAQIPAPQAPQGYTIQDMIRSAQESRPTAGRGYGAPPRR